MLCPEVWSFSPPDCHYKFNRGSFSKEESNKCSDLIDFHFFNHLVSVVLPDAINVPEIIKDSLNEDCDYYKVENLQICELVCMEFIEAFVKKAHFKFHGLNKGTGTKNRLKMPKKHQPLSMETLALQAVGNFVSAVGQSMINPWCNIAHEDSMAGLTVLQGSFRRLNEILYASVPWYLYDKVATQALTAIAKLIQETKQNYVHFEPVTLFINQMSVVVNLTEVAIHPNLRNIDFSLWPKIMRNVLYKNLFRMTGLEKLDLGSASGGWKTSDIEKLIVTGVANMKNLTTLCLCFDCTDHILTIVGQNCTKLQRLDVTASRSVTDRSVNILLNCKELKDLYLYRTSFTIEGYALLLKGLPRLEDLGRCDDFGYILEHLHSTEGNVGPFGLRIFQSRDVTTYHLNLLIEMCPQVKHVSIYHDERISDLTVLSALDELSELKLLSCDFYTDKIKHLLEVKGYNLTWLHLEHVEEIDLNALIYISQYCPNLKRLTFYNCEFLDHTSLSLKTLSVQPFRCLERIMCAAECALLHLEFLLSNCFNIKSIQLGSSTGIGDVTMANVLSKNPMKYLEELRILHSDNLSMKTVHLLMTRCDNLRVLSELESWEGITEQELSVFQSELKRNNIDLDVRPTLSYPSNLFSK
ncbi:hypothetical protein C0J52_00532 [Blattella germanica]|nr:hypothetical protein C0J52_00532 [Blattella germanica]